MARQTFTRLQNSTKDIMSISTGSVNTSTVANFIKNALNNRYHVIQARLRGYAMQDLPQTAVTVADQQFYHYPPDVYPPIGSVTLTTGGVEYPLTVINSQREWDKLNEVDFSGSAIPQFIFPRRDDFGIWPIPASAGDTITLVMTMLDKDMTVEDFTTGTVTVTSNDATIAHSATGFVAGMVGRWFVVTDSNGNPQDNWYRVASFTSTASMELESVYEGTTTAGATLIIGEVPEIPPDLHQYIPYGAAADFFAGPRKEFETAQALNNYFWTGDYNNSNRKLRNATGGILEGIRRYTSRDNSKIVRRSGRSQRSRFNTEIWTIDLS